MVNKSFISKTANAAAAVIAALYSKSPESECIETRKVGMNKNGRLVYLDSPEELYSHSA